MALWPDRTLAGHNRGDSRRDVCYSHSVPIEKQLWPEWLALALQWMDGNHIGDVAGVLGILISVAGFAVTVLKLRKAQSAAEAARDAATNTRRSLAYAAVLADFASGVAIFEEIGRFHQSRIVEPLPDRYAALRKILIVARASSDALEGQSLTDEQKTILQSALVNIASAQEVVNRAIAKEVAPDFPRLIRLFSKDLDGLYELLVHLKSLSWGKE